MKADSDPEGRWIEIEADSVFQAACNYEAYCCVPQGRNPPPKPGKDSIMTVGFGGREYRVRRERMMEWANEKALKAARLGRRAR